MRKEYGSKTRNRALIKDYVVVLLIGILIIFGARFAVAQSARPGTRSDGQEIDVTADKLSSGNGATKIDATGNVEIKRDLMTIRADEVHMDRETQDVEAKGKVSVEDPEWKIKSADSMQLNLGTEAGEIQNGDIFVEQGHISIMGRRFQKLGGQVYHIDDTFFTTCLCESGTSPWKFSAEQMDLSADGLGTIRNGYFYILDVPVFYLPYGFFPLKTERQTGFLIPKFGSSTKEGYRFQQPFFWAISKSTDATLAFDIETRARVGALGELRTVINRDSDFVYRSAYFNETFRKNPDGSIVDPTIADPHIPQNRWSVLSTHRYLTTTNWLTYSDVAAYGDDLFTRELIERFDLQGMRESDIRQSRFGASRFGVFKSWGDTFLKGQWKFYQDFIQPDSGTLQRTPQIAYWGQRLLSGFPLEFRWRAELMNYLRKAPGDGLRLDLRPEIVLPFKIDSYLLGSFSVAPRETFYHLYSPVKSSDRNPSRELVEVRVKIGTALNRVFQGTAFGLSSVKHVFEPEMSYLFVPSANQSSIPIMDGNDRVERRNVVTFALANRFWGKYIGTLAETSRGADVELLNPTGAGVREMASMKLAMSLDIDKVRKGGDSLSDIDISIQSTPLDYVYIGFESGVQPGPWKVRQAKAALSITDPRLIRRTLDPDFNRPNSFGIGYYFLGQGPLDYLAEDANVNLNEPATPSYCAAHPVDPRCQGFSQNIASNIGTNFLYHATDNILLYLSSTFDARRGNFLGFRAATKYLSTCECWALTFRVGHDINPAKTSFHFDINLLGATAVSSTLN
jgi:LPS-assembly protein